MEEALIFPTTHHMLTGESLLKREGFRLRLVPAPPGAGQVCSTAIAVSSADAPRAAGLLESEGVPVSALLPYRGWRERGARRVVEGFLDAARPYPGLAASLEKVAVGERLGKDDIFTLLGLEAGAEVTLRAAAGDLARFVSSNRATGLVKMSVEPGTGFAALEDVVAGMRETGHVYLLLDLGSEGGIAWDADSFVRMLEDDIVPIACVTRLPREAGGLVSEYGIRQVLLREGTLFRLGGEEVAEEIVFLQDNRPGPVGSGNLLPMLDKAGPAMDEGTEKRLETVTAVCRLALIDAHLPASPALWRKGVSEGADMPVLEAGRRPFTEVDEEAEEFLKRHGWDFARGRR